MFDLL